MLRFLGDVQRDRPPRVHGRHFLSHHHGVRVGRSEFVVWTSAGAHVLDVGPLERNLHARKLRLLLHVSSGSCTPRPTLLRATGTTGLPCLLLPLWSWWYYFQPLRSGIFNGTQFVTYGGLMADEPIPPVKEDATRVYRSSPDVIAAWLDVEARRGCVSEDPRECESQGGTVRRGIHCTHPRVPSGSVRVWRIVGGHARATPLIPRCHPLRPRRQTRQTRVDYVRVLAAQGRVANRGFSEHI